MAKFETIEDLWPVYRKKLLLFIKTLDWTVPGLNQAKELIDAQFYIKGLQAILTYYQHRSCEIVNRLEGKPRITQKNEDLTNDYFTIQTVRYKQPRLETGYYDWAHRGPNDDREWAFLLNRLPFLRQCLNEYECSGDSKYVKYINETTQDWILSNLRPVKYGISTQWRHLETSLRLSGVLPFLFYKLATVVEFSEATRLLLLVTIGDHMKHLRHYHHTNGNILVMNMNGLLIGAGCFPEFKKSEMYAHYAFNILKKELLTKQVYPDGVQSELTQHYHRVALNNFEQTMVVAGLMGLPIPEAYSSIIEKMWGYIAFSVRPNGYGLLNHDSDYDFQRENLAAASQKYGIPEWNYFATDGITGPRPPSGPSYHFPYAGHAIMRSKDRDSEKTRHWSFFEMGPYGTGHQHNDKLHFSAYVENRDVLVDSGRYWYRREPFRLTYFRSTHGHNTLLINGAGQKPYNKIRKSPIPAEFISTPTFDFAIGSYGNRYADLYDPIVPVTKRKISGKISHTRAVCYIRNHCWVIVDRITSKPSKIPRKAEILWHFHPDCSVSLDGTTISSSDKGQGNLKIISAPLFNRPHYVTLHKGEGQPEIQGWYSREYNHKVPAYCAKMSITFNEKLVVLSLLIPGIDSFPDYAIENIRYELETLKFTLKKSGDVLNHILVSLKNSICEVH